MSLMMKSDANCLIQFKDDVLVMAAYGELLSKNAEIACLGNRRMIISKKAEKKLSTTHKVIKQNL